MAGELYSFNDAKAIGIDPGTSPVSTGFDWGKFIQLISALPPAQQQQPIANVNLPQLTKTPSGDIYTIPPPTLLSKRKSGGNDIAEFQQYAELAKLFFPAAGA